MPGLNFKVVDLNLSDIMKAAFVLIVLGLLIALILTSLALGLYYLLHDQGKSRRVVRALTVRIVVSLILFFGLILAMAMGWIEPHSWHLH